MLKLNVLELLDKQGKTKYWLYKQLGMSYQNFSKMVNNETQSIRYENIEAICLLLNCSPNELFKITVRTDPVFDLLRILWYNLPELPKNSIDEVFL